MLTRRELVKTGISGSLLLTFANCARRTMPARPRVADSTYRYRVLDVRAIEVIAAVATVMLAGALPAAAPAHDEALLAAVRGFDTAVSELPPSVQAEIKQLLGLLEFAPTRWLAAGISSSWSEASDDDVAAFLKKWRFSSVQLFRSGYDALHQLTMAGWYASTQAWTRIGYPGPPKIA